MSIKTSAFPQLLVIFHGLAELPVAKESHMNLHFQREVCFLVECECIFSYSSLCLPLPWLARSTLSFHPMSMLMS